MKMPTQVKPFLWGAAVGAVAWWVVLAYPMGWVSSGAARKMTEQGVEAAQVALMAPICAAKFAAQKDAAAKTAALAKASSWERRDLFAKELVTLPGGWSPDSDLVSACTALVLKEKGA